MKRSTGVRIAALIVCDSGSCVGCTAARTPSDRSPARLPNVVGGSADPGAPARSSGGAALFSSADSGSSGFGGISSLETWSQSGLSSSLPGTTTGPLSPPRASDRGLLRLSFPLGLIGPWHFTQRTFNSGRTSSGSGPAEFHRQRCQLEAGKRRRMPTGIPIAVSCRLHCTILLPRPEQWSASMLHACLLLSDIARSVHNPRVRGQEGWRWHISPWRLATCGGQSHSFRNTLGWRLVSRPGNISVDGSLARDRAGIELHLIEDGSFEPSPFEKEFGRHIAVTFPVAEFPCLKERLRARGATLIEPLRETPFTRFFFPRPEWLRFRGC